MLKADAADDPAIQHEGYSGTHVWESGENEVWMLYVVHVTVGAVRSPAYGRRFVRIYLRVGHHEVAAVRVGNEDARLQILDRIKTGTATADYFMTFLRPHMDIADALAVAYDHGTQHGREACQRDMRRALGIAQEE